MAARAAAADRGQLDASPTLFTVMAAINAAGYDAELTSATNHPLRNAVRQAIAAKNPPCLAELKKFYDAHRQTNDTATLSQYVSFALAVDGLPDFTFKGRAVEMPPDAQELDGFAPLLERFAKEVDIEDLWKRSQPAIEQYLGFYHTPVLQAILQVNGYLRQTTSGFAGSHFQIYVDLLAAPNQVQTRSYGARYFVVVTPSVEPRVEEIRHAYLYYLLDPLATRNSEILERKKGLIDHAVRARALADQFKSDFLLLTTGSLVKAIEARLDKKPQMVTEALRQGYILAAYFAEQLPLYEKQEAAMRFYYADMVKAIDLRKEDARLSQVEFAKEAPVRVAKSAPASPAAQPTGAARILEEAESLYTSRDLDKSKEKFLEVLRETAEKPLHAKAYYGLARVALLQKDPETAERLFQKVLELGPEPQDKSWCYVYLGRLADLAGEHDSALKHYQAALAIEGASEKARETARQGLQGNFKKQER
jgi:predicted negative regulator of RcsB-dependent stress response